MKKVIALAALLAGGLVFAGSYSSYQEIQLGPAANAGTTRARPTSATEGTPCGIPSTFSSPYATKAKVTVTTVGLNTDAGQAQWWGSTNSPAGNTSAILLDAWEYGLTAYNDGGSQLAWVRNFSLDQSIMADGGIDQQALIADNITIPSTCSQNSRFIWACRNCYSTGTSFDAGAVVTIELTAP